MGLGICVTSSTVCVLGESNSGDSLLPFAVEGKGRLEGGQVTQGEEPGVYRCAHCGPK